MSDFKLEDQTPLSSDVNRMCNYAIKHSKWESGLMRKRKDIPVYYTATWLNSSVVPVVSYTATC